MNMKLQQNDYEQQFNNFCAAVMSLHPGNGHDDQIYFNLDESYAYKIKDYVPYTNEEQAKDVVEYISSNTSLYLDVVVFDEQGPQAACRKLIEEYMNTKANKDEIAEINNSDNDITWRSLNALGMEIMDKRLLNAYCAKIMGWHRDKMDDSHYHYFDDAGNYFGKVENYNPYDNIEQIEPVIDSLLSTLGLWLDSDLVQREGIMVVSRQLILDNMLPEEETEDPTDNTPDIMLKEDVFNISCARYMGIETMYNNLGYGSILVYAPTRDGWDNPEPYNPWDDMTLLTEVMERVLVAELIEEDDYDILNDMYVDGFQDTWRNIISEIVIVNEDRREQTWDWDRAVNVTLDNSWDDVVASVNVISKNDDDMQETWDHHEVPQEETELQGFDDLKTIRTNKIMDDFTHIGDPQNIYWQAARILILTNHRGYDNMYVDITGKYNVAVHGEARNEMVRFDEFVEDGLLQAYKIEAYIRNPENCMEMMWVNASAKNPYILPEHDNAVLESLHAYRLKIIKEVLHEMSKEYITDEKKFDLQCSAIIRACENGGYCFDLSTFDPYNDIRVLTGIVEKVISKTGHPLKVSGWGNKVDMMETMREYILKYGNTKYMNMEPLEDDL